MFSGNMLLGCKGFKLEFIIVLSLCLNFCLFFQFLLVHGVYWFRLCLNTTFQKWLTLHSLSLKSGTVLVLGLVKRKRELLELDD